MALRSIDNDAEVFYQIGRLQRLLDTISDVVSAQPFSRDGESDEGMRKLEALTSIAASMLKGISTDFDAMFAAQVVDDRDRCIGT